MKKYILATLILFIPCVTYALTMCARDDSLVISLVGGINGISGTNTHNAAEFVWRVDYNYGTILGEATCLSNAEGGQPSGGAGVMTNVDGEMLSHDIPKGYKGTSPANAENPELNTERGHCWCRMTHPASSRWVFQYSNNAPYCSATCAYNCALNAFSDVGWRSALFRAVGK